MTKLKPETTHVVSYWHIPGGGDYSNAMVCTREASSLEEAESIASRVGYDIPAMAMVLTREQYEQAQAKVRGVK